MDEYQDEVAQEKWLKPKLFSYPDWDAPVAVFDFEELENTEAMLVLCVRKAVGEEYRSEDTCYVWCGPDFDINAFEEAVDLDESQFVQKCIKKYWGEDRSIELSKVKIVNEQYDATSEAFTYFFD